QLHSRRSELQQEQTQLNSEHGPNFPRVVEIRDLIRDIDLQIKVENRKLLERFQNAWTTAVSREELVRRTLNERTDQGMRLNEAVTKYAVMRQEANSSHELYMRVVEKTEESGLAAGIHDSNISVVDRARQPIRPFSPDLPLYMAITLFVSIWLALGGALMLESIHPSITRGSVMVLTMVIAGAAAWAQAPTPSTSGLPTGV